MPAAADAPAPKPNGDGYETVTPGLRPSGARNGGLPDTLMEMEGGARVGHGTDAGDYYCEHMFFQTQKEAMKSGSRQWACRYSCSVCVCVWGGGVRASERASE